MGSEWTETTLGELCENQGGSIQTGPFGSQLHASDYQDAGTPVVMPVNLVDGCVSEAGIARVGDAHVSSLARHKLLPGDIVFSRRGDVTRFALITERESGWLCGTGCLKVSLGEQELATAEFVAGVLSLPESKEWLVQHAVGATMPNLNTSILSALPVRLPDLATQRSATSLLTALTARMESLRQTNVTLEAIAQALFKSWFVDFDPVRAKAERREPEGMDAATASLFPSEFEASAVGLIPKGWQVVPFGSLLRSSIGGDWGAEVPDEKNSEKIAIIRGTDIPDLRSQSELRIPIRYSTPKKVATRLLEAGDLIIEVSGGSKNQPTGRSVYITEQVLRLFGCAVVPASFCRKFSPASIHIGALLAQHMDYIYLSGRTWEYQNQSTGIANFQTKRFLEVERVVIPTDGVLGKFCDAVIPIMERCQDSSVGSLIAIRDTLLSRLISGKLRLPEAEREVEAATA